MCILTRQLPFQIYFMTKEGWFSSIFATVFCASVLKDELEIIDKHMSDFQEEDTFHV